VTFAHPVSLGPFVTIPLFPNTDNQSKDRAGRLGLPFSSGLNMRNGFLGTLVLLVGAAVAQAQQWPTYGYPQYSGYGYPQYSGYGYPQYSGYGYQYPGYYPGYYTPRSGGYYPGYQQWTPQQVQVNSALVYPRAGYATPVNNTLVNSTPQNTSYSLPPPRVVTLPQTVSQTVPEPLPTGSDHPTSAPLVPQPAHVLPPSTCCGAGCAAACCDQNDLLVPPHEPCCPPPCKHECFWVTTNFLLAWTKAAPVPPLVTTGFAGVMGIGGDAIPGALGQPNTAILVGNNNLNFNLIPGFRIDAGIWLDHDNHFSLEASGFYLPQVHKNFFVQSDASGSPLITRPIFNPVSQQEEAFIVALPGLVAGDVAIGNSQTLWGAEVNGRCHRCCGRHFQLEGLFGVRYLNLIEKTAIDEDLVPLVSGPMNPLTFLGNQVNPPNTLNTLDSFRTTNQFTGLQLGGAVKYESERFFFDGHAKVAVGFNQQTAEIAGTSLLLGPAGNVMSAAPGGILALPSNIGSHQRTLVSVLPEAGITAGVNVTCWLRLTAGYNFLYLNNVVRPTTSIDRTVNPNQVPTDADFGALGGPGRPAFQFHEEGFWVHMLNVGVEFHY
jgi:hypothetical protein